METASGGCQCGAIRYEALGPPGDVYVCHCEECRRQSSSAFGISVIYDEAAVRILKGETRTWRRPAAEGDMTCHFCGDCGARLFHFAGGTVSVKGGSLDEPPDLAGCKHIWVKRKLPGVVIPPGAETFEGDPP
ncbi:MAG: GFA family protein [Pseudomonadota bacterium]